jgi:3-hydroxyisobutyrate dehydrogenase
VLAAFGKRIEHMGPVGTGAAMKAVNNALLGANIIAFGEGFTTLVKNGVPAGKAVEVLNASSGRSFVSEVLVPERVLTGTWPRTFRLALLDKDVAIAVDVSKEGGIRAPLLRAVSDLLHVARAEAGEDADYLDVIRLQELHSGVEIRALEE